MTNMGSAKRLFYSLKKEKEAAIPAIQLLHFDR